MAFFAAVSLTLGVVLVWLYAAVRPCLGPGPTTAAISAAFVWLVGYLLPNAALAVYGFSPASLVAIGTLWGPGELLLAEPGRRPTLQGAGGVTGGAGRLLLPGGARGVTSSQAGGQLGPLLDD